MEENKKSQIGTVMTNDFTFWYKSGKKKSRDCLIPDPQIGCENDMTITLHEQLAIMGAIKTFKHIKEKLKSCECPKGTPATDKYTYDQLAYSIIPPVCTPRKELFKSINYVFANIGCVITRENYLKGGNHTRHFITHLITFNEGDTEIPNVSKKRDKADKRKIYPHSEECLLAKIMHKDLSQLSSLINKMLTANDIEINNSNGKSEKRKIYALIFDLHSTQDTCGDCQKDIYKFVMNNIDTNSLKIKKLGLEIPKVSHFKILFRISSIVKNTYSDWVMPDTINLDTLILSKVDELNDRNLKEVQMPLILHNIPPHCDDHYKPEVSKTALSKWYRKSSYQSLKHPFLVKPTYACFENSSKNHVEIVKVLDKIDAPDDMDVQSESNTNLVKN